MSCNLQVTCRIAESERLALFSARHAAASALLLVLVVVCAVVGTAAPSELSAVAWTSDPEAAKMQLITDSLTVALNSTKAQIKKAAVAKAKNVATTVVAQKWALTTPARENAKKYMQHREYSLRDVFSKPDSKNAMSMEEVAVTKANKRTGKREGISLHATPGVAQTSAKRSHLMVPALSMVSLKAVDSLTAALKELEASELTPVRTKEMATQTLAEIQQQLASLEGGVNCARKEEYDKMLGTSYEYLRACISYAYLSMRYRGARKSVHNSSIPKTLNISITPNKHTTPNTCTHMTSNTCDA